MYTEEKIVAVNCFERGRTVQENAFISRHT